MQRQGTCNLCGQCCGAEGSPNQANPWPKWWARSVRNWSEDTLPLLIKLVRSPWHDGPLALAILIGGNTYHVIWIEGRPCKDLQPWGDESTYSLECPFLMDNSGNDTRPCALVGTPYEFVWLHHCQPLPPLELPEGKVAQWQEWHPLCSYTWS